jgi:hypothetical protein
LDSEKQGESGSERTGALGCVAQFCGTELEIPGNTKMQKLKSRKVQTLS